MSPFWRGVLSQLIACAIVLGALVLLMALTGCATPPVRTGAGECVIFREPDAYVIGGGGGCQLKRVVR